MNKELLAKLKQVYAHLGLAENILQLHADALVATGLVTAENIDDIVAKQKDYLEGLQKYNDSRVSEALKTAGEKALKEAEEKAKKAAEEAAQKAREEAAAKAAEEARKAQEIADKEKTEAARKAAEEAAAKAREEALKALPESVKAYVDAIKKEADTKREAEALKAEEARKAAEEARKKAEEAQKAKEDEWLKTLNSLKDEVAGFKKENEDLKKAQAAKDRENAILAKAKELGIPQYRIDEGFVIAPDADENTYTEYLANIAKNIRANSLPGARPSAIGDEKQATKEEVDSIAKNMVANL